MIWGELCENIFESFLRIQFFREIGFDERREQICLKLVSRAREDEVAAKGRLLFKNF